MTQRKDVLITFLVDTVCVRTLDETVWTIVSGNGPTPLQREADQNPQRVVLTSRWDGKAT